MIYDCFLFNDELEILDIRLNYLDPIVDKFVICESAKTFTGRDKRLYFKEHGNIFSKFAKKIIYHTIDSIVGNAYDNEKYQRDCLAIGLRDCKQDDIIMLSDCDEIPRIEAIKESLKITGQLIGFEQELYYYYLNGLNSISPWKQGSRIFPAGILQDIPMSKLRDVAIGKSTMIKNGGWHFSYIGGAERISQKIKSFHHTEYDKPEYTDIKKIKYRIENGKDLFGRRRVRIKYVPIDNTFPDYIVNNHDKFKGIIHA